MDNLFGDQFKYGEKGNLYKNFGVPPFSFFNTKTGSWQKRKREWNKLIGDNAQARKNARAYHQTIKGADNKEIKFSGDGVSLLDPVLAELVVKWFALPGSNIFDCFAGDTIFGYVSSFMGNNFTGIELRKEQVRFNRAQVGALPAKYICGDGQNILKYIDKNSMDLFFSCPPYFDLEKYSDLDNDASNQSTYNDYLSIVRNALNDSCSCLKKNRFAVIVISDVRDKITGGYLGIPKDIINIMMENNMLFYNEIILLNSIGTAAYRANNAMKGRKVIRLHQNVLVFFKGKTNKIKEIYPYLGN